MSLQKKRVNSEKKTEKQCEVRQQLTFISLLQYAKIPFI